jgi:hypothetical protein
MEELAGLLNRERMLLELLLFKLVSLRQLLLASEVRFLPWAAEEVDRATAKVREAGLRRSLAVEDLSVRLGAEAAASIPTPSPVRLDTLAESAPEPWRTIFAEHRHAFLELAARLEEAISATQRLARSGDAAVSATLDCLFDARPASPPRFPRPEHPRLGHPRLGHPSGSGRRQGALHRKAGGHATSFSAPNVGVSALLGSQRAVDAAGQNVALGDSSNVRSIFGRRQSDHDLGETSLELRMSLASYQAALAAADRSSELPSLADFFR